MVLQFRPNSGGATALMVGRNAATTTSVNLRTGPGVNWSKVNVLRADQQSRLVGGPVPDANGDQWFQISGPFGTGWTKAEFLERRDEPISIATLAVDLDGSRAGEPAFRPLSAVVIGALGPDTDKAAFFPSTGHTLSGAFYQFWAKNGGLSLFGLPLSEPFNELNAADGKTYLTQYFEHVRLEYHPAGEATGNPVQIGALGRQGAAVARINTAPVAQRSSAPLYSPDLFTGIRWIEVNLSQQRLTAWQGDLPVLSTLIRSGKEGWRTPTGTFRTFRKVPVEDMTLGEPSDPDYYYTAGVPWIMYFLEGGFALHGAVMDDLWGTPTSHGCVNIPVDIAAYLYEWAPLGILVWIHH
jgi:lipoprotein-anchoring transpeptidase ErfK/SrfK